MRIPKTNALESISALEQSETMLAKSAVKRARGIVYLIEQGHFPMPFVFPTEIGGIQFEWKGRGRELNLEIPPEGEHFSFLTIVDGQPVREGEIITDFEREVCSLLNWMVAS